jgi:hypothetical protein
LWNCIELANEIQLCATNHNQCLKNSINIVEKGSYEEIDNFKDCNIWYELVGDVLEMNLAMYAYMLDWSIDSNVIICCPIDVKWWGGSSKVKIIGGLFHRVAKRGILWLFFKMMG